MVRENQKRMKKKRVKIGAGLPLITGPLDARNHIFDTDGEIAAHAHEMERKRDFLQQQIPIAEKEFIDDTNNIARQKMYDQQRQQIRAHEAHERQMRRDAIDAAETEESAKTAAALIRNIIKGAWEFIKGLFHVGDRVSTKGGNVIDKTFNGGLFKRIVSWFLFLVTLGIIIVLILILTGTIATSITKPSGGNSDGTQSGSDKSEKCKKFLGNSYTVNIDNGGWEWIDTKTLSTVLERGDNMIRPNFDAIKQLTKKSFDEIFSNPAEYLGENLQFWYDAFVNSEPLKSLLIYAKYLGNYLAFNLQSMSGGFVFDTYSNTIPRDVASDGRCDNIAFFDSSLFPKQLLREKNMDTKDSVINLSKPIDIEWKLPEVEYNGLDISKLPPTLVSKKNSDNISLEDKKTIVIPWVNKNNHYVLSCEDAYFKNNFNEKANLFVDIDDEKCTYNIQSTPQIYTQDKTQYKYTNDLSTFV